MLTKDKKYLVVGLGKSGLGAAEALLSRGWSTAVYDKKVPETLLDGLADSFRARGAECFFGEDPAEPEKYDVIIISPGVPKELPFVAAAERAGALVIGELELAWQLGKGRYVAITGTNGKTTTTVLTGEIFRNAGRKTEVVGNVGLAVTEKALEATEDTWMITETSSFQLDTTVEFHPHISALLNLTPDHMDRHKTLENYGLAKAMVFRQQDENDYFIVNYDDKEAYKLRLLCRARIVPFSRKATLENGCFVKDGKIVLAEAEKIVAEVCETKDIFIPGAHNLENALAASAMAYYAGIKPEIIGETLRTFRGVEHRMEFSGELRGVRFVNDSKGTNPDASIKAIEAVDGGILLIAGGYDKGSSYEEFIGAFGGKVKKLILLGKTAPKIKETAESMGFTDIIMAKDMKECVEKAFAAAAPGDTVLLSPACASWDMYSCFEERGEDFKACVKALR